MPQAQRKAKHAQLRLHAAEKVVALRKLLAPKPIYQAIARIGRTNAS